MSAKKAADDVKNLVNKLKPLLDLGEYLERVANLEGNCSELQKLSDEGTQKLESIRAKIEEKNNILNSIEEDIVQAKMDADKIVKAANLEAIAVVEDAEGMASKIKKDLGEQADILNGQVSAIKSKINQMKLDAAAAEKAELQKKKALLENISKDIEKSEESIKSLEM